MSIPTLKTFRQFSEDHPAFSVPALYDVRFKSRPRSSSKGKIPANGFAPAFITRGRRVLIWEERFFEILMNQQAA